MNDAGDKAIGERETAAEQERAAILAWLRNQPGFAHDPEREQWLKFAAEMPLMAPMNCSSRSGTE